MIDDRAAAFRERTLTWYREHGRSFSWRQTTDPYHVLIAEIMLRRTRAAQVEPVFDRFVSRFSTVFELAAATDADVRESVYSLGLAWRAPVFQEVARAIVDRFAGAVPREKDELLSLPGVGEYVANAVRCFAFGEPEPLYDTNTVRVAGRYFGFSTHAESRRRRPVQEAIRSLLDIGAPGESNFAILDLAALICTARVPECGACPVQTTCVYGRATLQLTDGEVL